MSSKNPIPLRAVLRVPKTWIVPALLSGLLIVLISLIYVGSVVNPTAHLSDLPVLVVNEDHGATVDGQPLDVGAQVTSALEGSTKVTSRLELRSMSLAGAQHRMDQGKAYAAIVIPADFTQSLVQVYGLSGDASDIGLPTVTLLTNQRSGTLGTSLATGVAQPAITSIMSTVASKLTASAGPAPNATVATLRANPVIITTQIYRPLPAHSALGLSAFYIALLTLMCGFLCGTITNSSLDSALGFAPTEIGPRWRLRRPLPLTRWQTLLTKWSVAAVLAPALTGLMLTVAVGLLHMYAPNVAILWLFTSFAAIVVAMGTLVLFAAFGSPGQLLAMIGFLYLSLASSGGTIPIEALPTPLRWAADIEPLRQILGGVRAIMYFNDSAAAGLTRGLLLTGIGLVCWVLAGIGVTRFYDRRGLARISPEVLAFVNQTIGDYHDQAAAATLADPGPSATADPGSSTTADPGAQVRPKADGSVRMSSVS